MPNAIMHATHLVIYSSALIQFAEDFIKLTVLFSFDSRKMSLMYKIIIQEAAFQLMAAGQIGHFGPSVQSHVGTDSPTENVLIPTLP